VTLEELGRAYDSSSKEQQVYFLARLMKELTIMVRSYYSRTPQIVHSDPDSGVGVLNEIQHQAARHVTDVLLQQPDRASGNAIIENLMGWAQHGNLERDLTEALVRAWRLLPL